MEKSAAKYTEDAVNRAVAEVKEGKLSLRAAAQSFGIPKSTLADRIKGKWTTLPEGTRGAPTVLSQDDEKFIEKWILGMAAAGFPVTERCLIVRVAELAKVLGKADAFKDEIPSRGWMAKFLHRHPTLSRRTASSMAKKRIITEEDVRGWYTEVCEEFLSNPECQEALSDPSRVMNMDESPVCPVPKKQRVLAKKGTKNVKSLTPNNSHESYTVLMTGSADGKVAPPLIIYPYKERLPMEVVRSVPRGWGIGKTGSGWMNSVAFFEYISKIFYPWLLEQHVKFPVILFVDGHKSHATYETAKFCKEHEIVLICLLPNSTHVMQPLDVSFFAPMKTQWDIEVKEWMLQKRLKVISRTDFAPLLERTLNAMNHKEEALVNGFRKCALVPFDVEAFDFSQLSKPNDAPPELTDMAHVQSENIVIHPNSSAEHHSEESRLIETINSRLSDSQLELFMHHRNKLSWSGPIEDSGLFYFWRNLMDEVHGPPDYLMLDSPYNQVLVEDIICTDDPWDEPSNQHGAFNEDSALDSGLGKILSYYFFEYHKILQQITTEISLQVSCPPQDGHEDGISDQECSEENPEVMNNDVDQMGKDSTAKSQKRSKKRTYPSVVTSDEWFRIYNEEQAEKLAVEQSKKRRIQERKEKKLQKENEKKQKAEEKLKKKKEKEMSKKR